MATLGSQLGTLPIVARFAILGAAMASLIGGLAGLIVGLIAYPPTAWFAVLELGIPAGLLGGVVGGLTGLVASTMHKVKRR
jgi:hypothetical protein